MMRRVLLAAAVILMMSPLVRAQQEVEPDEPEIVLPPMLLEVEDLSVERVEAAIPEGDELPAPTIDLPMPEPEELEIPDEAFDLPLPSQDEGMFDIARTDREIFSEGIVGIGSMHHILGSLSLYKLGDEPRFRFQFLHEGLNGFAEDYGFNDPGTGYFRTENLLSGALELRFGNLSLESTAAYQELTDGLQEQSTYYDAISHRFSSTSLGAELRASDALALTADADVRYTSAFGSFRDPADPALDYAEFVLSPSLGALLTFPYVNVGIEGRYGYRDVIDEPDLRLHRAGGMLSTEISFPFPLNLDGSVGVAWTSEGPLRIPFSAGLSTTLGEMFTISVQGGYEVEQLNFSDLWRLNPYLAVGDSLNDPAGFFVEGDLQWLLTPSFVLEGGVRWSSMEDSVIPEEDPETDTGLFAYEQGRLERLQPFAGFNWKFEEIVTFSGRWQGEIFDRTVFDPFYSFIAAIDITESAGRFGASVSGVLPIYDDLDLTVPELDLAGYFRVSEVFRFILEANDILSLGLQDGRRLFAPYIGPGFFITLKVQITL